MSALAERRSYRAETLEQALRLVSEELGPDAIVVRQREGVIGGIGGFFGRRCVELEVELPAYPQQPEDAASPLAAGLPPRPSALPAGLVVDLYDSAGVDEEEWPPPDGAAREFVPFVPEPLGADDAQTDELAAVRPEDAVPGEPVPAEPESRAPEPAPAEDEPAPELAAGPPQRARPAAPEPAAAEAAVGPGPGASSEAAAPRVAEPVEPEPEPEPQEGELELAGLDDGGPLVRTLLDQAAPFADELADALERTALRRRLAYAGLSDRIAHDVFTEAEAELRLFSPLEPFQEQVRTALARRIRVARATRKRRRVIALVGPPGSGKTLTAARLCHAYRGGAKRPVAALSLQPVREAFRLAEHTRALDVPVTAAEEVPTLQVELGKLDAAEVLVVDTPGVDPGDETSLRTLATLLELVGADETHLLVPASLDAAHARTLVEAFSSILGANRLMITHLDGPGSATAAVSASIDARLPISFTSTGGSWGLRPADPHDLAELVVP